MKNISFWEKNWLIDYDYVVIGAGIVGCFAALKIASENKNAKVALIERGILPLGASTKNAGFACFGSISEIEKIQKEMSDEGFLSLIELRIKGLEKLRSNLGDKNISFSNCGGHELFFNKKDLEERIYKINDLLSPLVGENCFSLCNKKINSFGFSKEIVFGLTQNKNEGSIDPGKMMFTLKKKIGALGVDCYFSTEVESFEETTKGIRLRLNNKDQSIEIKTNKLAICNNAFSKKWFTEEDIIPGRGIILMTNDLSGLKVNSCFHYNEGYYYFRNVGRKLLIGGGREIDKKNETTFLFGINKTIRQKLINDIKTFILPNIDFNIESEWSGIMGFGKNKLPLIKQVSENVVLGVRLGGMGISIGSIVGEKTAELILNK
ncbi:MAG: NAD(P)/FAD-dependent oxidoreductase [Flavobacteriaceae bacterium]